MFYLLNENTFSSSVNDDKHMIRSRIAKLYIGELMSGNVTLSIKQLITHLGPSTLLTF